VLPCSVTAGVVSYRRGRDHSPQVPSCGSPAGTGAIAKARILPISSAVLPPRPFECALGLRNKPEKRIWKECKSVASPDEILIWSMHVRAITRVRR